MSQHESLEPTVLRGKGRKPLSQQDIERTMVETVDELEELTKDYRAAIVTAAAAEARYKTAHAKAYLRSTGSNGPSRSAYADSVTESELQEHLLAEALAKYNREAIMTKRNVLEMLRSLNSNLRELVVNR